MRLSSRVLPAPRSLLASLASLAALTLALAIPGAPGGVGHAAAQEFEPLSRHPAVRVPVERITPLDPAVRSLMSAVAAVRTSGEIPMLVIPALFQDSPEPTVTPAALADTLFATEGRSLTVFYQEMSFGQLTVVGNVPDWVRTSVATVDAAGDVDGHGWIGGDAHLHFGQAIAAVDDGVDFTLYDNDGPDGIPNSGDDDGFADAVTFKYIEVAGSCGGPGFWPHRGWLRDGDGNLGIPTADMGHGGAPIRVGGYTTDSAIECDGETPQGASVMAHEFGHVLGLPDFYRAVEGIESFQRHWMAGCFALMAAGSWGCGDTNRVFGFGPSGLSPLSRQILGWGDAIEVGDVINEEFVLPPVQIAGQYLKVPLTGSTTEYLLIEYRPLVGFDDALPAAGVLVYHVDEAANILGGASAETFPYWLIEADGHGDLRRTLPNGGNRGTASDVFALDGALGALTPATTPATRLASGTPTRVWIHSMAVEDGAARIRVSTTTSLIAIPFDVPTTGRALEPLEIRYQIQGGQPPYEAVDPPGGWAVEGLTLRMDGTDVVVDGVPLTAGAAIPLPFHVRDADGDAWWAAPIVEIRDAVLDDDALMNALLGPAPDADTRSYLDNTGNRNGSFDVGDLRAYLLRTGG